MGMCTCISYKYLNARNPTCVSIDFIERMYSLRLLLTTFCHRDSKMMFLSQRLISFINRLTFLFRTFVKIETSLAHFEANKTNCENDEASNQLFAEQRRLSLMKSKAVCRESFSVIMSAFV